MGYPEIVVVLLVYSGLIAFFLIPFHGRMSLINYQQKQINFIAVFKDTLIKMIFHKKAIFALILLSFTLFSIWSSYEGAEYHFNAHSGYPPISTDLKAIYSICGVLLYTVVLYLLIAFVRTLKIVKNSHN
ncbi:hypothetical protein JFL43_09005 [Viridibacillus sp. YIM B01967]|uniref:Uncharacterized protein n=1 Tax=Viridibacillus soli TaxID=2798301 RepID=A0ABS1H6G8_9BACL|nr:hypothetical protein [Viridibacillus soli]MBK3494996.1 hypothetical protein [Viridibacillus soli]